mgnify:CR=1 FL=1
MSAIPPVRNINDVLMASKIPQPKKEWEVVICWAVCYTRRLVRSPFSKDPLVGNLYAGQTVRPCSKQYPTAQKLAECRWNEEDLGSKHGNGSDLSFLEVLRIYGPEAFDSKIVWQTQGPRWQVQTLANDNDIALILDNGGVLRDIDPYVHIDQTFNRQKKKLAFVRGDVRCAFSQAVEDFHRRNDKARWSLRSSIRRVLRRDL